MIINIPIIICYFFKLLTLSLFIMLISVPIIVLMSFDKESYILAVMNSDSYSNSSQYFVFVSLFQGYAQLIDIVGSLWANTLSARLAQMLMPLRYTCNDMTVSCFSSRRYKYSFTILSANCLLSL